MRTSRERKALSDTMPFSHLIHEDFNRARKLSIRPPHSFSATAHVCSMEEYGELCRKAADQPEEFWGELAQRAPLVSAVQQCIRVESSLVKWFTGGKTNLSYNCLDRHLENNRDKVAFYWEGEPGDMRTITYGELHGLVCRFANVLKARGLKTGDRSIIYMPMVPEAAVAMLAARAWASRTRSSSEDSALKPCAPASRILALKW